MNHPTPQPVQSPVGVWEPLPWICSLEETSWRTCFLVFWVLLGGGKTLLPVSPRELIWVASFQPGMSSKSIQGENAGKPHTLTAKYSSYLCCDEEGYKTVNPQNPWWINIFLGSKWICGFFLWIQGVYPSTPATSSDPMSSPRSSPWLWTCDDGLVLLKTFPRPLPSSWESPKQAFSSINHRNLQKVHFLE